MNKNKITGAVVVGIVIVAAVWYALTGHVSGGGNATVAIVNGTPITRSQLTTSEAQFAAQQGLSATSTAAQAEFQTTALNLLIGQTLIKQAAQKAGVTASSTEVDAELQAEKAQFSSQSDYEKALASQAVTEADLRAQISDNLVINTYLGQELNLSTATATAADIQTAYNLVASEHTAGASALPPLAQVRAQVAQMVVQQKQESIVDAYVAQLRAAANVQILIATSTSATSM